MKTTVVRLHSAASMSGTYNVIANGGVITSASGVGHMPLLYLASANKGFWLGTGNGVQSGFFEPQVGSSFTNASLSGSYVFGNEPPTVSGNSVNSGFVAADGAGSVAGTSDHNNGGTTTAESINETYAVSANGRVVFVDSVMYLISTSKAVMIETTNSNPNSNGN